MDFKFRYSGSWSEMNEKGARRFRPGRTETEENRFIEDATPASTRYKTKWATEVFKEWQGNKAVHDVTDGQSGYEIQPLSTHLERFNAESLAFCLSKFVQEVVNRNGEKYPARTLYGVIAGIKRFLEAENEGNALNPLDRGHRR